MYYFKFCHAILVGFCRQLTHDGKCKEGFIGLLDSNLEKSETPATLTLYSIQLVGEMFEVQIDGDAIYKDDLTGQVLDHVLVMAARQKELDFFETD